MRNAIVLFHRWLALATSIVIFLLGVTGSALVFEGAIDRELHPELWRVTPSGTALPLDTVVARARSAVPKARVTDVLLSGHPDRAYLVLAGSTRVFVNPYSGAVLGTRDRNANDRLLPRRLHLLHVNLMLGRAGGEIIALATLASFLLVLGGVYLWWADKLWRIRWRASWKRIAYDLHHSLGIVAALVLLAITGSGMIMHYHVLGAFVAGIGARPQGGPPAQTRGTSTAVPVSLDSAMRAAKTALSAASVSMVTFPLNVDLPYVITMRFPEDRTPGGRSRVYVDRFTGTVLLAESTRAGGAGARLTAEIRSIHTGDVFGKPTEALWLVVALILSSQAVTGFLMWWNGRAARAATARSAKLRAGAMAGARPD